MNDKLIEDYIEFKRQQAFKDDGLTIRDLKKEYAAALSIAKDKEETAAHTAKDHSS